MIDADRVANYKKQSGFVNDFIVIDKFGDEQSYIQNYAKETDSFFDTNQNYNCVNDYNSIKRFDIVGYILKEFADVDYVNLFIEILQGQYEFISLTEVPKFKIKTLIRKHRDCILRIKNKNNLKNISNSQFLTNLIINCWDIMSINIDRILIECNLHTFKNIDDYNLYDFIKN